MVVSGSTRAGGLRLRLGTFLVAIPDSRLRMLGALAVVGVCAAAAEFVVHEALRYSPIGQSLGALMDAALVGLAAAGIIGVWLYALRERRKRVLRDMAKIAELNHNIRNALQVIAHSHYGSDDVHTEMVLESVDRIERTLEELFPIERAPQHVRSRVLIPDRRLRPR